MTATTEAKPWDFSHVLDLVNSLSLAPETGKKQGDENSHTAYKGINPIAVARNGQTGGVREHLVSTNSNGLGDFDKLWQFLGAPIQESIVVHTPKTNNAEASAFRISTSYTSDGAIEAAFSGRRTPASRQKITPSSNHDKIQHTPVHDKSSTEDQATDTLSDGSVVPDTPSLTKSQRKKKNRRERRAQEAALEAQKAEHTSAAVSESEANQVARKTPAKKASVHTLSTPTPNKYNLRPRDASGKVVCASEPHIVRSKDALKSAKAVTASKPQNLPHAVRDAVQQLENAKKSTQQNSSPSKPNGMKAQAAAQLTTPHRDAVSTIAPATQPVAKQINDINHNSNAPKFAPSSVRPVSASVKSQAPSNPRPISSGHATAVAKHAHAILPMTVRSGEDRHWALLMKLIRDFYSDCKYLVSPMNLTTHNNNPSGIHVFVDASNIFIGFNDQLKRSRGIPQYVQLPPVDLSFDALALLMERRRPVAKRVLVGSTPHLPAFDKAKAVGYECNILEKVYKARELTERQIFFKEQDRAYQHARSTGGKHAKAAAPPANNVGSALPNGGGAISGSETSAPASAPAPQFAPPRMIEQGVDEILHLKILESVVDTDAPSTIVLATGDAARAEYSEGFMAMAERALKKGWKVELVSWSANISQMYTRREWKEVWGERFRVVTLDDYAEELLDM